MFSRTAAGLVCLLLPAFMHNLVQAQVPVSNKPVITLKKAAPPLLQPAILPGSYAPNIPVNFIRSREALGPFRDEAAFDQADYTRVKEVNEYFDALSRPLQTVQRQWAPGSNPPDVVMPVVYDNLGREAVKYLPYAQTTGTHRADGSFKPEPFSSQQSFYKTGYRDGAGNLVHDGEEFLYAVTTYENSPLNRVSKTMAAGNSWAGSGRGTGKQYLVNSAADTVHIWNIVNTPAGYVPESRATYHPGELFKHVSRDEHGNAVVEYEDRQGQIVLKKLQAGEVPVDYSGFTNWLCTYYVFDDLNRLRFVIPPKAVERVEADGVLPAAVADELCFRYEYDEKQRVIAKKVPGAAWIAMVYDQRDRLVFAQSGNMSQQGRWMVTLYDDLNRSIATGIMESSSDRDALQRYVNTISATVSMVPVTDLSPTYQLKVWMNPVPVENRFTPLTITHYDDYVWTSKRYTDRYNGKLGPGSNLHPDPLLSVSEQQKVSTRGMVTGTLTRILEDPANLQAGKWLSTTLFYDSKARVIQTHSDNYAGGMDLVTNRYDFTGRNICTYMAHNSKQASPGEISVKSTTDYDHAGRLLKIWKTVNDQDDKRTLIASNQYDELGMLRVKELGQKRNAAGTYASLPLEKLNYSYNIRGWLRGINASYSNADLPAGMGEDHWFGMELNYDWGSEAGKNQFNGNISSLTWKSKGDGVRRAYGFTYDQASRLLGGDFSEYNGSAYTDNASVNFDMVMGNGRDAASAYDANGNIRSMDQWGMKLNTSVHMDRLSYRYKNDGLSNQLSSVSDNGPLGNVDTKLGDFVDNPLDPLQVTDDYAYDLNGNLLYDKNKNIRSILYNHLNLPQSIIVTHRDGTDKGRITYTYDASGNKLGKKVLEYAGPQNNHQQKETTTIYVGGFVYGQTGEDTLRLAYISHEEGRIRLKPAGDRVSWSYDYFIKDHLGNIRMVLTDEQEQAAYPAASLEDAGLDNEKRYYTIPDQGSRVHKSNVPGYPQGDSYTNPNNYIQKLSGNGVKVGTATVLKVMSGDRVNIRASSWYRQNGVTPGSPESIVEDIVSSLAAGISGVAAGKTGVPLQEPGALKPGVATFLDHTITGTASTIKPKAYLNWILLDEQLKPVITGDGKNSGFEQVGADQSFTIHQVTGHQLTKNGYLYIYVSNATPGIDVFFDNLQVTHIKGPLLEETHYYPFGLTMAGISSKAAGGLENRNKYNGIEFTEDLNLDIYEAFYRNLDPQTGRWWQIDPKTENMESWSPYASNYDNPVTFNDPLGDEPEGVDGGCPNCRVINPSMVVKGTEIVSEIGNAVVEGLTKLLVSAGGVLNGGLNTLTFGAWPNNPAETITGTNTLTTDQQQSYDASVTVGQVGAMVMTMGEGVSPINSLKLAPLNELRISLPKAPSLPNNSKVNSNSNGLGSRRQNRLPDRSLPNSTLTNIPGTTTKKYGPDGNVKKEFNKGHQGNNVPRKERSDHVHDYKPNPLNPSGRGDRQSGRAPKKNELKRDFGL